MHVDVRDFWYWCSFYLHNHFQVFRVYTVPTSRAQFLFASSATRGPIVFMSWGFIFFLAGFLIPSVIQFSLIWGAKLPPRIKPPKVLKGWGGTAVSIAVLGGLSCMIAAVFLTILSMYEVQYSPIPSGISAGTPLLFTNSVRIAFWVVTASACFDCGLVLTLFAVTTWNNIGDWPALKAMYLISPPSDDDCRYFSLINNLLIYRRI